MHLTSYYSGRLYIWMVEPISIATVASKSHAKEIRNPLDKTQTEAARTTEKIHSDWHFALISERSEPDRYAKRLSSRFLSLIGAGMVSILFRRALSSSLYERLLYPFELMQLLSNRACHGGCHKRRYCISYLFVLFSPRTHKFKIIWERLKSGRFAYR